MSPKEQQFPILMVVEKRQGTNNRVQLHGRWWRHMCASVPRRCQPACKLSQEQMPPHYNDTKASALCSELRLLLVSKKGPATLKGLVNFSGSGPPGSLGHLEPNTPFIIAWGVFWPIIQFPGWFFRAIWRPVIRVIFYPKNTHFRTHLDLELHLDGAEKCPTHLSPLLGLCFGPLFSFQVGYRPGMAAYHDGPFWTQKRAVFGRPLTWK